MYLEEASTFNICRHYHLSKHFLRRDISGAMKSSCGIVRVRGWYPAFDHVSDEKGEKVKCDILRFEHYNEDTKLYLGLLQNPNPRNVTRVVPNDYGHTGYGRSYKDIYTKEKETVQIVADWYKKDIDYWGFDFDTPATRNYWNA